MKKKKIQVGTIFAIIGFIAPFIILFCIIKPFSIPFSKEGWHETNRKTFTKRHKMVKDLEKNYLKEGVCEDEIKDLLGPGVTMQNANEIHYALMRYIPELGEPEVIKSLVIALDKNGCFESMKVVAREN